jgi:hypothetical protein
MSYIYWGIILWLTFMLGFAFHAWMIHRFREYGGTIVVGTDEIREKTVYSLILDDYPEKLEFKKEIVFKVDTSGQSSNRG